MTKHPVLPAPKRPASSPAESEIGTKKAEQPTEADTETWFKVVGRKSRKQSPPQIPGDLAGKREKNKSPKKSHRSPVIRGTMSLRKSGTIEGNTRLFVHKKNFSLLKTPNPQTA
ncbi:hypothetical protein J6590_025898 [Homalodisca vitripennis]|nr:hypothetical protein J6590_025898 [Homalodisca vitripennis]